MGELTRPWDDLDAKQFSDELETLTTSTSARPELVAAISSSLQVQRVLELGVYRGELAEVLLNGVPTIRDYFMLDPWRHLEDWAKPANVSQGEFQKFFEEAMLRTDRHADKRRVLRGTTSEVVGDIAKESLDLAYIDADHTLRGVVIDLTQVLPLVREGGVIVGDDFCPSIWQHEHRFEPSLVFPFAVNFAEAHRLEIFALPFNQFLIRVDSKGKFAFSNLSSQVYPSPVLKTQVRPSSGREGSLGRRSSVGRRAARAKEAVKSRLKIRSISGQD